MFSQLQNEVRFRIGVFLLFIPLIVSAGKNDTASGAFDQNHTLYNDVVKKNVLDDKVNYAALKADSKTLDQYLADAAKVTEAQFKSWNEANQLAFLINLYNASTLRLILDHYPLKSIKDIGGFFKGPWDQQSVRLFGNAITLNTLEHEILRKKYNEPRIHMALVCAAKGCPPLRSEAYTEEKLKEQLDDQSRKYLASASGLRIDRTRSEVHVSSIFKWYGGDLSGKYTPSAKFDGVDKTKRAVMNFCAQYLSAEDKMFLEAGGYAVKFLDYDWSLNEMKEKP
jgi:hypothetical protein